MYETNYISIGFIEPCLTLCTEMFTHSSLETIEGAFQKLNRTEIVETNDCCDLLLEVIELA